MEPMLGDDPGADGADVPPIVDDDYSLREEAGDDDYQKQLSAEEEASTIANCSDYDDDSLYTADSCGGYDKSACSNHCASGWCYELCGTGTDSCEDGSGAVCAMTALNDLKETCARVLSSLEVVPGDLVLPSGEDDDGASNEGCDEHVFCQYCNHGCKEAVGRYAPVVMSTKLYDYFLDEGSGPTAMGILSNITAVCDLAGYNQTWFDSYEAPEALGWTGDGDSIGVQLNESVTSSSSTSPDKDGGWTSASTDGEETTGFIGSKTLRDLGTIFMLVVLFVAFLRCMCYNLHPSIKATVKFGGQAEVCCLLRVKTYPPAKSKR
eukprot:FR738458.1.p1 GENE.FR738458.1~~FR738458.1.p1  ORF type:complete len:346 (+),score=39.84 FR738458.1:74-1039(+)